VTVGGRRNQRQFSRPPFLRSARRRQVTLTAQPRGGVSTTFALQLGTSQESALSLSTASLAFGNWNVSTAATQSVTLSLKLEPRQ